MRKLLLVGAIAAFVWAAIVYASGGIAIHVAGGSIRSRDPFRALVIGSALVVALAVFFRDAFARDTEQAIAIARRLAPAFAIGAALVVAVIGIRFGTFAAGSADSYGYVSQAYGWARFDLPRAAPLPLSLPSPVSDLLQAPLGYRPGPQPHTIVPTYAPGLPLMMAVALLAGNCGPYLVVPVFGAILVWTTFVWGRRADGPLAGAIAALIVLTSPIVVFQVLWPMSDIPAGALWTAASVAALTPTRRSAVGAGLLTAAGLLVRPNLPLVTLVPLTQVALGASGRERWIRTALAAMPVVFVAAVIAALYTAWYGAPWNSGYGGASELYSLDSVRPNLVRYSTWLWQSHSGWVLAALVPLLPWRSRSGSRAAVRLAYLLAAATAVSYIAYFPFDAWWYLRFMLPAIGALAVLMGVGILTIARRLPSLAGRLGAFLVLVLIVLHTTRFSAEHGVFGILREDQRRYIDVGAFIARTLPDNAVVFTMQHSGGVRFYGGRYSLRYDFLEHDWVPHGPADLERLGYHPYLVIDDSEAQYVRAQFHWQEDTRLPWRLIAHLQSYNGVSVFDMSPSAPTTPPVAIQSGQQPFCAPPQPLVLRRRP